MWLNFGRKRGNRQGGRVSIVRGFHILDLDLCNLLRNSNKSPQIFFRISPLGVL